MMVLELLGPKTIYFRDKRKRSVPVPGTTAQHRTDRTELIIAIMYVGLLQCHRMSRPSHYTSGRGSSASINVIINLPKVAKYGHYGVQLE